MLSVLHAECHRTPFMLSVPMLNVIMLSVVMLNVIMLSVVTLNVNMLSVVAPFTKRITNFLALKLNLYKTS